MVQVRVEEETRRELVERVGSKGVYVEDTGDGVMFYGEDGHLAHVEAVLADLAGRGNMQVTRRPGNLEDVFLRLTGRGLRD